ncbi:primosomal protein N' [Rathayibacter sp. YIM 133350]|uniref:primosomal protein N' family DNA-binding protein n=1 Tax=Rathayibacter sp. YIM 133350 TaxID=3131992 RepID=UPI00307D41D0
MSGAAPRVARVVIDSPLPQLDHPFDYRVPAELAEEVGVGMRVRVPFGNGSRAIAGYVVELIDAGQSEFDGRLGELESLVSAAPVLTPELAVLARTLTDRAAGRMSDLLRVAIPPRQVRVEKRWLAADPVPPVQVPATAVSGYASDFADELAAGGRVAAAAIPRLVRLASGEWVGAWALTLAELAARTLAAGRSSILVVPDHRDQAQLAAALAALIPASATATLDARQPDAERYAAFLRCLEPAPVVVIGNRSAVYAPASSLGLLAVWDDGDPLYAEPLAPYVHTRDAALVRQEQSGCALLLLGHTRSVETERLVQIGWLSAHEPHRPPRPRVVPTALQSVEDAAAQAARIPSTAWREARAALADGPVLVQVASPGYAPWVACASCREAARCQRCHGPLGVARAGGVPSCRLCGAVAAGWTCENCGGHELRTVGVGSQRTAEELGRAFPGVRVILADGEHTVLRVEGTPALVIATRGAEPIAAGGYAAVLLLDGERMLARESLRVGEDCLRWWSNAAALAAPGAPVLLAGVSGPVASALTSWRQAEFARAELADRRALRFPPAVRVASLRGTADEVGEALRALESLPALDVLGPVPSTEGVRAVLRFDYSAGAAIAAELRAMLIRVATRSRRGPKARRSAPTLRVRFDDPETF